MGTSTQGMTPPKDGLTQFLGWFSLGLGVPQTATPGEVSRAIGVRDDEASRFWNRVVGVRELAAAGGILSRPKPTGWVWARVAGDVMDLSLLTAGLIFKRERPVRTIAAMGSVASITVADVGDALRLTRGPEVAEDGTMHVKAAVTVGRPRDQVYAFWRDLTNLPSFMLHLESVQVVGGARSRWSAKAPAGRTVEWEADLLQDVPGELIAWRSIEGSHVRTEGSVRFVDAPGDRGTEVRLDMRYTVPGGSLGSALAMLSGEEPQLQVRDELRRFKQVMETGIVVHSEGSPEGTSTTRLLRQRPAQPLPDAERSAA
jgi:uncharacterized membrane protein